MGLRSAFDIVHAIVAAPSTTSTSNATSGEATAAFTADAAAFASATDVAVVRGSAEDRVDENEADAAAAAGVAAAAAGVAAADHHPGAASAKAAFRARRRREGITVHEYDVQDVKDVTDNDVDVVVNDDDDEGDFDDYAENDGIAYIDDAEPSPRDLFASSPNAQSTPLPAGVASSSSTKMRVGVAPSGRNLTRTTTDGRSPVAFRRSLKGDIIDDTNDNGLNKNHNQPKKPDSNNDSNNDDDDDEEEEKRRRGVDRSSASQTPSASSISNLRFSDVAKTELTGE